MPISGNATTTRINRATNTGGAELQQTLLEDGSTAPRVVLMDDAGNLVSAATEGTQQSIASALSDVATEQTQQDILAAIGTLDGGVFAAPFSGVNGDVVTLAPGMPVVQPVATLLRGANNAGESSATVVGLVVVGAAVTLAVRALAQGVLTLPESTWDARTGGSGGLVPGARYYLGALGALTTTPPSTPGQYVCHVGSAISAVTMLVDPQPPILL